MERKYISYLFKLRHPVPRPNFDKVRLLKNQRANYFVGTAHEEGLDYEPLSPGQNILRHFCHLKSCHTR